MASTRRAYRLPHHYQFPRFPDVWDTSVKLASLPDFREASMVFVSNENVLDDMKVLVRRRGKTLVTSEQTEDDHVLTKKVHEIRRCEGNQLWRNEKLSVGDKVDLMVVPSVAVDKCGRRVGLSDKRDLLGLVYLLGRRHLEGATIVTLVHDRQVYEEGEIPEALMGGHDLPVDIVVTPKEVIKVERVRERPKVIDLSLLTYEQVVGTPILWRKVLEEERERSREVVGKEKERRMLGEATDRGRMVGEIERKSVGRVKEKPKVIDFSILTYEQIVGTPILWRKVLEEERERKILVKEKERTKRMGGEIERKSVGRVMERQKRTSREDNNLLRKNLKRVGKCEGEDEKERSKDMKGGKCCKRRGNGRDKVDEKRSSKLGESENKTKKNSVKANISVNLPKSCSRNMLMKAFGERQVDLEDGQFKIQDDVATIFIGEDSVVSVLKKLEGLRIGGQVCRLDSSVKVSSEKSMNMGVKIAASETVKKNISVSQKIEERKESADANDEKEPELVKKAKVPVMFACMDIREKYRNT